MPTDNSRLSLGNLAAAAVLVVAGFAAGRLTQGGAAPAASEEPAHGNRRRAAIHFEVSSRNLSLLGSPSEFNDDSWRVFQQTQVAYLKSPFVLQAALRTNGVPDSGLSVLQGVEDPIEWLQDHLVVWYPKDGEILEVALTHPSAPEKELRRLVEAIGKAYLDEIVFKDEQRRRLPMQLLKKSHAKLLETLRGNREDYAVLLKEQDDADAYNPELIQRELEIESLQGTLDSITARLQKMQIEVQVPQRVRAIGVKANGAPVAKMTEAG